MTTIPNTYPPVAHKLRDITCAKDILERLLYLSGFFESVTIAELRYYLHEIVESPYFRAALDDERVGRTVDKSCICPLPYMAIQPVEHIDSCSCVDGHNVNCPEAPL